MTELVLILVLGVIGQWVAWRLRVPSILLLLLLGFLAGPVTQCVKPDHLLGPLLLPMVSLSVALILFEGGLSLHIADLRQVGGVVRNLVSFGAITTAIVSAGSARYVLGFHWSLAALLGAILMVTGPTVIGPLLRQVRPIGQVGPILRWEGIVIDPIGALCAVLVFEAIEGAFPINSHHLLFYAAKTAAVGLAIGLLSAWGLMAVLRRYWVPDSLHIPVTLMAVGAAFAGSNAIQPESGLFTVTVMGIALANQRAVPIHHIIEFKETLSVILISSLFIVLGARLQWSQIHLLDWRAAVFLAILVLVARPAAVAISTVGSSLTRRERVFLACIAPRGIVAAAVASVFALRLRQIGAPQADRLEPMVFFVIAGTVIIYGLSAAWIGRGLGVARPNAQGCLIVGANPLARAIGMALKEAGHEVLIVDTNRHQIAQARMEGLHTFFGSIVSPVLQENIELSGIGRLLALTPNDEINALAAIRFARVFGRSEVYQVAPAATGKKGELTRELRGRLLFGPEHTWASLDQRVLNGATLKKTRLTLAFDRAAFAEQHGNRATPLFLLPPGDQIIVISDDQKLEAQPGTTVLSLVDLDDSRDISASEPDEEVTLESTAPG